MNRDRIGSHWKQMKGRARKTVGRWAVTDRDLLHGKMRKDDRGAPAPHSGATGHWRSA